MATDLILNPVTSLNSFGTVPTLRLNKRTFPESSIVLSSGRHFGPNRGFGARHIWAEHRLEMAQGRLFAETDVPLYVLSILVPGTPLFYEGASWANDRLMVVRSAKGTVILEYRERREGPVWAVVTAFSGTKTHGTRVGTVR